MMIAWQIRTKHVKQSVIGDESSADGDRWRLFGEDQSMDALSEVLQAVRLQGTLYFSTEFGGPWGVCVPSHGRVARFHLVVRGSCWIRVEGGDPVRLDVGDLALVPHGSTHDLLSSPTATPTRLDQVLTDSGFDGTGALTYGEVDQGGPARLVCGHFEFSDDFEHPFLKQLPSLIPVRWAEAIQGTPLEDAFRFVTREVRDARPGHQAVVRRMSEVLFVQVLRNWANSTGVATGFMTALSDPGLHRALSSIHNDPARSWTLESLSRKAAMGRTTFAERFREHVGTTPHQYLTEWRIQQARRLLSESSVPLRRVAREVGYESAASFSRAFKASTGASPGEYRKLAAG